MAVEKKRTASEKAADNRSAAERAAAVTLVECPCCKAAGMVTPSERVRIFRALPDLEAAALIAEFLDEDES